MEYHHTAMASTLRLRHLEVFLAVAMTGSMQRASRAVHLTQPAISKMIRQLEEMLRAPLLERSKRGVTLTECGRALVDRAQLLLNDINATADEVLAIHRGVTGKVRLGVLPVAEAVILPKTLLALRKSAPNLSVQVEEGTRPSLLNALRRGEVDCVIGRLDMSADERGFYVEKLIRMPISMVASPSHPLARAKRVTWRELSRYPWVLPQRDAPIRDVIESQFMQAGLRPPKPTIESTSNRLNYAIVRETDMISVMTQDAALGYVAAGTLAALPAKFTVPLPYVGVITRTQQVSYAMATFLNALRTQSRAAMKGR
jgi:DNA-binding transcriptional LysR family regulator